MSNISNTTSTNLYGGVVSSRRGTRTYSTDPNRHNPGGSTRTYSTDPNRHNPSGSTPTYSPDSTSYAPDSSTTSPSTAPANNSSSGNSTYNGSVDNFMSTNRSKNVKDKKPEKTFIEANWDSSEGYDWRVRLSLPNIAPYSSSSILEPLRNTDNSMIWPYTPTVIITHTASYNSLSPTHNNYTYPAYQNSSIEQMTITGGFSAEHPEDAKYWVAATHFLRSITKMSYGESDNLGAPPPVVKLYGYGDYVFNGVPVVIESFIMNLPNDVDYIKAFVGDNGSWVPTYSEISVTVRVAYSRDSVNKFDLNKFVNGDYLNASTTGFI